MSNFEYSKHFPKYNDIRLKDESPHLVTLNGQQYLLSIFLDDGDAIESIPTKEIDSLVLVDNFLGFEQTGVLTYSNPNYTIGRFINRILSVFKNDTKKCIDFQEEEPSNFQFKGGSLIHIKFQMMYGREVEEVEPIPNNLMMHTYAITNVKDSGLPFSEKKYTIEFEGIESYILKTNKLKTFICGEGERNLEKKIFNNLESYPPSSDYTPQTLITHRAEKTGVAIYRIMNETYSNFTKDSKSKMIYNEMLPPLEKIASSGGLAFSYSVDVTKQQRPKQLVVDNDGKDRLLDRVPSDFWDLGADDSYLFTQFDKNVLASDMVHAFHKYHTSGVGDRVRVDFGGYVNSDDPCILKLQRPTNENSRGVVTLRPLKSYFSDWGDVKNNTFGSGSMGGFVFDTSEEPEDVLDGITKFTKPLLGCEPKNTRTRPKNAISEFNYDPINPKDSARLFKTHIANYTSGDEPIWFNFDGKYNNIVNYIGDQYISKIADIDKKFQGVYGDLFNVATSDFRTDPNNAIEISYANPPTLSAVIAMARNRAILTFIFMNDAINFNCEGSIERQSGRLFSASSFNKYKNDDTKGRIYGVYLCSRLEHHINIREQKYTNVMHGVKFYKSNI